MGATSPLWADTPRTRAWENVDRAIFESEIIPRGEPAILKGLASGWRAIEEARRSPAAFAAYLKRFSEGKNVETFVGAPAIEGRFTYGPDLKSFNFEKRTMSVAGLLDVLLEQLDADDPPAVYAGAINIPEHAPRLFPELPMDLLAPETETLVSLWIGNRTRTAAHWDLPQNIACVISGRRRFTLLPTDQLPNLYIGPLDLTLAGRPTSLVNFRDPDFDAHPRFREAMAHAEIADLDPGDALYLPSLWMHHVESRDRFGVLLNFWWRDAAAHMLSPFLTILHSLLTIEGLPPRERAAWKTLFDHYVFHANGDPLAHVPEDARGLFGAMTPEKAEQLKAYLRRTLG